MSRRRSVRTGGEGRVILVEGLMRRGASSQASVLRCGMHMNILFGLTVPVAKARGTAMKCHVYVSCLKRVVLIMIPKTGRNRRNPSKSPRVNLCDFRLFIMTLQLVLLDGTELHVH